MTRRLFLAMGVAALLVVRSEGQTAQPRFRTELSVVQVDASVLDEQGEAVTGLTAADFDLLEDGQPQQIVSFSEVDSALTTSARFLGVDGHVSPDVRSNRQPVSGRLYVVVLDDMNINPMRIDTVRSVAREFIDSYFGAGDIAAVMYTSGRIDASQDFTSDPQLLLASIDKFLGRGVQSSAMEAAEKYYADRLTLQTDPATRGLRADEQAQMAADMQDARSRTLGQSGKPTVDIEDFARAQRVITVFDTLRTLAESLAPLGGRRKSVVMFSEGFNYQLTEPFGMRSVSDVLRATQDALNAAARANLSFYTIDPRMLDGAGTDFMQLSGPGMPNGATQTAIREELQRSQDSLRVLAEETGGFATLNTNAFASAFDQIVQRNSQYYVLGYAAPQHQQDGRFHSIDVRVKRPGVKITARRGYASQRQATADELKKREGERVARDARRPNSDKTSTALRDVLGGPLQESGLGLSVHAAPFRHSDKESAIALAIEIHGDGLPLSPPGRLELSFYDVNDRGKAGSGVRKEIDLALKPETAARIKSHGIRLNQRIMLAPGRYQLRFGVRESTGGQSGSVFYDLTVPDFGKDTLALSGLLVTSVSAQQTPTAEVDATVATRLPGAATSRREFPVGDTLAVFAEAYANGTSRQPQQIGVTVRVIAERGDEVFNAKESAVSTQSSPATIFAQFALEDLTPGVYLVRVETQLSGANSQTVARETLITVVPR
jgi:VWFA-related protein